MKIENILAKFVAYYRNIKIRLDRNPRKGVCEACGRRMRTQRHHWRYKWPKWRVVKNPKLVLDCSNEYCFPDHRLADVLRKWFQSRGVEETVKIVRVMFGHLEEAKNGT